MKKPLQALLLAAGLLISSVPQAIFAQGSTRIANINNQAPLPSSVPSSIIRATLQGQEVLVIAVEDSVSGSELWISNGTTNGTYLLKDIVPGVVGSNPEHLTAVGDKVFFSARNAGGNRCLWVTNGTLQGTVLLRTFNGGDDALTSFVAFNGKLIFSGLDSTAGRELWESDGTVDGTKRNKDITQNALGSAINHFYVDGSRLYFTAVDAPVKIGETADDPPEDIIVSSGRELWQMSPDFEASMVMDLVTGAIGAFSSTPYITRMGDYLYFVAEDENNGREVWRSDLTVNGTEPVANVAAGALSSDPAELVKMTVSGTEYLFFAANNPADGGRELYRSDGTVDGGSTIRIKDINPNSAGSDPYGLIVVGNKLYFGATDGNGTELHFSTGVATSSNTRVADLVSGAGSSNPANFIAFGTKLLFTATDSGGNTNLYFSESTATTPTATLIRNVGEGAVVSQLTVSGSTVYFLVNGTQLWASNGTNSAGTTQILNFAGQSAGSNSNGYTVAEDGFLYFSANDGLTGQELWRTDGTTTTLVADIRTTEPTIPVGSSPANLTPCAGKLFFTADATGENRELWVTDGTQAGTRLVVTASSQEINPTMGSNQGSNPEQLTAINGVLYFIADNGTHGAEPWRTDGTPEGTYMISDQVVGGVDSDSGNFILFKGQVYFSGRAGTTGSRLRKLSEPALAIVDGTSNAPAEITSGPDTPTSFVVFGTGANQRMMFAAGIQLKGRELWRSDGVSSRTEVFDINQGGVGSQPEFLTVAGNGVFFVADDGKGAGRELWRSTGSLLGTKLVKDLVPGSGDSDPQDLVEAGGRLFFTARYVVKVAGQDVDMGRELWVSDGTPNGTKMVKEIVPGAGSPGISHMRNINGLLVFSADDGVNGREVWTSDGTTSGTTMLENLGSGSASSNPSNFVVYNGNLIYTATDAEGGAEPRKVFVGSKLVLSHVDSEEVETVIPNGETFNFSTVQFKASETLVLTIKNDGNSALTGIKPLLSGVNAKEFSLVAPRPLAIVASGASTTMGIKFTPTEGGPRQATLSILSNDTTAAPFTVQLVGNGQKDPTITQHPVSLMLNVGEAAEFEAAASGSGSLALQWKKGGGNIAGATQNEFSIPSVVLKDGAAYSLFVKGNPLTALSNPAELGVVEDNSPALILVAAAGKAATFKVNAAGNKLTYRWLKNGEELADDATKISGSGTKAMTVKLLSGDDTAVYSCRVSNDGGSRIGGTTRLNVYTQSPLVEDMQGMPYGVVGGWYSHQVRIDTDPARAALTYSAKGLPPGLKINAKTGEISGRPTKASPSGQPYQVIITAKNTINPQNPDDIVTPAQSVEIAEFPAGVEGIYAGTVEHNGEINGHLGGRLDLTITKTGAFSGSLLLGGSKLPLKGSVEVYRPEVLDLPNLTLVVKRTGKPLPEPVTLFVELDPETGLLTSNSKVTTSDDTALVTGWRRVDSTVAADYMGFYTFGLDLGDDAQKAPAFADKIPQGWGYASFTVAKDGKLSFVGSTSDGEKITGASFVGVGGRVVMYQTLYAPLKGSLVGNLVIDAQVTGLPANVSDNTLTGDVEWARPADPKSKTRMYTAGFGMPETPVEDPVPLEAAGSFYTKPIGTALLFDLAAPVELDVRFTQGGLDDANRVNATVTLNAGHKVTQDATPPTGNTKLASVAGATGLFKGDFSLSDPDPLGGSKPIARKVPYQGLWIKDGGVVKGVGYYKLPQLPETGQTATTSPIFGGRVELIQLGAD